MGPAVLLRWAWMGWRYAALWAPVSVVLCDALHTQPRGQLSAAQVDQLHAALDRAIMARLNVVD